LFENLVYFKIKRFRPCYIYQNGIELDFYFDNSVLEVKYNRELEGKQKDFFDTIEVKNKYLVKSFEDYLQLEG